MLLFCWAAPVSHRFDIGIFVVSRAGASLAHTRGKSFGTADKRCYKNDTDPIGLAGRRLNRSAKVSLLKLAVERTRLPLPGDRMLWLDAPDTYVHLAIPLFRGAPNLACQPQLGEQNFQIFNNMNAPLAQWLERWSYEP